MTSTHKFFYFKDEKYPIEVTDETLDITPYTFSRDGILSEQNSLYQFFNDIDKTKPYNIIDIGAQSGLYSLFSKYLPLSKFYAFEPFPATFKILNENLLLNGIQNVSTYRMAISDKKGPAVLNTSLSHNGLHTLGENPLRFYDVLSIPVETTTLDIFFKDLGISIDYIKIDTEGYEYYILKGGLDIIKKYKPIIQIEYYVTNMHQCNVSEVMMQNLIDELGYYISEHTEEEYLLKPIIPRQL